MIHYVVPAAQARLMFEYLGFWGHDLADRIRVLPYEDLPDQDRFQPGTYILSGLDQLGEGMARLAIELHRELASAPGFRLLNEPGVTLGRYALLTELQRRGLNDFRVHRASVDLDTVRYPVFLRAEHTHDGAVSPLLRSRREVEAAFGRALLRGRRLRDLLVVEFSETTHADRLYRRYTAFFVGDRVIPRGLAVGKAWMLKETSSIRSLTVAEEELEYVTEDPHSTRLAEIRSIARVDYGRIDYTMRRGRVETWEINLNPRIGRATNQPSRRNYSEAVREIRTRSKEHFYRSFQSALRAVEVHGGRAVRPAIDATLREEARGDSGIRRPPADGGITRYLERFRPALEVGAGGVLPLIGRLALRVAEPDPTPDRSGGRSRTPPRRR
jgi:hypothetical protein